MSTQCNKISTKFMLTFQYDRVDIFYIHSVDKLAELSI